MNNPNFWRIPESTLKELGSIYAEMKQFYIDDDRTAFDFLILMSLVLLMIFRSFEIGEYIPPENDKAILM